MDNNSKYEKYDKIIKTIINDLHYVFKDDNKLYVNDLEYDHYKNKFFTEILKICHNLFNIDVYIRHIDNNDIHNYFVFKKFCKTFPKQERKWLHFCPKRKKVKSIFPGHYLDKFAIGNRLPLTIWEDIYNEYYTLTLKELIKKEDEINEI